MKEKYLSPQEFMKLNDQISEREAERKKNLAVKLKDAKDQCPPDKERFSIDVFKGLYDLTNDRRESIITPELIEALEVQYYLTYGNLKSMEEFAKLREELDAHNVN